MADPLRPSGPQIPGRLMGEIQSEVAVEATPLLSFVLRNSRIIVTCIVLLVLVIAGVGGWQWHQTRVEREAHLELGRILVSTQGPERIAALETFLPAAPSAMKSGVQLEIATTALGLEQYGKAADAYAAVAAADPKGSIGMMAAINQLPATFKEVILLHYYQGMNIAEIAQMLELPEGTISSRLSRGRKKLESILLKGGDAR